MANDSQSILNELGARLLERSRVYHAVSMFHSATSQELAADGRRFDFHVAAAMTYGQMAAKADEQLYKLVRQNPNLKIPDIHTLDSLIGSATPTTDTTQSLPESRSIDLSELNRLLQSVEC